MAQYLVQEKFLRAKLGNGFCFESIPGAEKVVDLVITQDYFVNGFVCDADNFNHGDKVFIEVIHPVYGKVGEFTDEESGWFITKGPVAIDLYAAFLSAGLILRARYVSVGPNVCKFTLNLIKHKRVELVQS